MADSLFASIIPARSTDYCWLIFNTHPVAPQLFGEIGKAHRHSRFRDLEPQRRGRSQQAYAFHAGHVFQHQLLRPDQCGRIAYRSLPWR